MLAEQELGRSGEYLPTIGMGTWAWGDKKFWRFDPVEGPRDAREAFDSATNAGIRLIDTAEGYGNGKSERLLGRYLRETGHALFVATKFAPFPTRLTSAAFPRALDASLKRLGLKQIDLYQIHYPYTILSIPSLMNRLADAVEAGKIRYAGVSNYSAQQMRRAHEALARRGIALVSNQVQYSLIYREPERKGLLHACRELGITLIAYSPLAMGLLSGKYRPGLEKVRGARRLMPYFRHARKWMPVIEELEGVARKHDKTPAQIALNWLARQDQVLPIPGAKNCSQAEENAGAIAFELSNDDAARLDRLTKWSDG